MIEVARARPDPVTYDWVAQRLTEQGQSRVPARLIRQVLRAMRDRHGSYSWTPLLTAFVVAKDTGEPGEGYYNAALGDAQEVRTTAHRRLAAGIY